MSLRISQKTSDTHLSTYDAVLYFSFPFYVPLFLFHYSRTQTHRAETEQLDIYFRHVHEAHVQVSKKQVNNGSQRIIISAVYRCKSEH